MSDERQPQPETAEETPATSDSTDGAEPTSKQHWLRRASKYVLGVFTRADRQSHGYVPFLMWIILLFGGIWFPATPFLDYVFNGGSAPQSIVFGTRDPGTRPTMSTVVGLVPICIVFWTWTNLALLCVMASAMGEVNRHLEKGEGGEPSYRTACTRAFFVYLFILLNELAVAGSLAPNEQMQGHYSRIAVLASLFCFVASYRPTFYRGLVQRIAAPDTDKLQSGKTQAPATGATARPAPDQPGYDREQEFASNT